MKYRNVEVSSKYSLIYLCYGDGSFYNLIAIKGRCLSKTACVYSIEMESA